MSKTTYKANTTRTIVAIGVFSALAYACTVLFHFKAAFLSFDLKDAVMTVGAMLFGPLYGIAMSVIVSLIEFITISGTGIYGLIMNVASSVTFVCIGSAVYCRMRSLKGAILGMTASVAILPLVMICLNLLITPFYMDTTVEVVISMILPLLLPFNLTKAIFNASLVFIIYKPISTAVRRAGFVSNANTDSNTPPAKISARGGIAHPAVIITAALIAAAALAFFFIKLGGSVELAGIAQ